ncbi:MAG: ABC transporter ATP-binding protein [Clostridia bacterium]|nr:ABC transporter ATP-binding protein [Clostridia bacterium]
MKNIIEIRHLTKKFGEIVAVNDLSFSVKEGELFAFLGINGAGKSTTINILCKQLAKDAGEVLIDGISQDVDSAITKRELGVVFQNSVLDMSLTVLENLESRAALYGLFDKDCKDRIEELARLLDFSELLRRPVGKLSGGQRRRIDIARALLHHPKILILDEPTTGLDPQTRSLLWRVISDLRKSEQMTVFLTTHYMEETTDADHIVILDSGRIVAEGTPLSLKNAYTGDFVTLYGVSEEAVKALGFPYTSHPGGYRLMLPSTGSATALIIAHPELFVDYEITKGNMDDVFLAATGKSLGEERGK